jgi:ClpP class serine protease
MTKSEIIQHITSNHWLVTEQVANSFCALIASGDGIASDEIRRRRNEHNKRYATQVIFEAGKKRMPYKAMKPRKIKADSESEIYGEESEDETVTPEGIAIVYIKGVIQKDSDYCTRGTTEINNELIELGEDPNIKGVILCVDSGGGQVAGTEQLADTIYNFKRNYKKRIEAVVDMAGSAAYWIVSGCDKIYLSGQTACVGSIGTMATIVNQSVYEAMLGISIINIYATLSTNKNIEFEEAQKGNYEPMRADILDKLNNVFLSAVIRGRYRETYKANELTLENIPEQLTGKIYFGKDGISVGLADGIATLEQALKTFDSKLQRESESEERTYVTPEYMFLKAKEQKDENKECKTSCGLTKLKSITKST